MHKEIPFVGRIEQTRHLPSGALGISVLVWANADIHEVGMKADAYLPERNVKEQNTPSLSGGIKNTTHTGGDLNL